MVFQDIKWKQLYRCRRSCRATIWRRTKSKLSNSLKLRDHFETKWNSGGQKRFGMHMRCLITSKFGTGSKIIPPRTVTVNFTIWSNLLWMIKSTRGTKEQLFNIYTLLECDEIKNESNKIQFWNNLNNSIFYNWKLNSKMYFQCWHWKIRSSNSNSKYYFCI